RGLQALGSYTWSHSIDNGSNDSTALPGASRIDYNAERGPSDFDVRHSFSGALTYDIPMTGPSLVPAIFGHWATGSIFTARRAASVRSALPARSPFRRRRSAGRRPC